MIDVSCSSWSSWGPEETTNTDAHKQQTTNKHTNNNNRQQPLITQWMDRSYKADKTKLKHKTSSELCYWFILLMLIDHFVCLSLSGLVSYLHVRCCVCVLTCVSVRWDQIHVAQLRCVSLILHFLLPVLLLCLLSFTVCVCVVHVEFSVVVLCPCWCDDSCSVCV